MFWFKKGEKMVIENEQQYESALKQLADPSTSLKPKKIKTIHEAIAEYEKSPKRAARIILQLNRIDPNLIEKICDKITHSFDGEDISGVEAVGICGHMLYSVGAAMAGQERNLTISQLNERYGENGHKDSIGVALMKQGRLMIDTWIPQLQGLVEKEKETIMN